MSIEAIMSGGAGSLVPNSDISIGTDPKRNLGRDDFLTLLVAQLQHQDPLNPMDSTEFTSQLAQYSSLEQLFNIGDNLKALKGAQEQDASLRALAFVGKEIKAEGNVLSLAEGKRAGGSFILDDPASCMVLVTDSAGNEVRRIPMGAMGPGAHAFEWDGRDDAGRMREPGVYGFQVAAVADDGSDVPVKTRLTGTVSRVNLEGDAPILYVGDIPVSISEVIDVAAPGTEEET